MNQVSTDRKPNPVAELSVFMGKLKGQMALALPKHMNADRMTRLTLTAFSTNPALQKCTYESIAGSIMVAAQMGLEPGVNGQGYLIPYKTTCTFVPGWKGIVDIANRSGRSSVWTGAVFVGDEFDYAMGDRPFITHKPGRSCSSLITANGGNTITKGQPLAARPKTFKPDFEIEHTKVSYVPTLLAWRLGIFLVVMFVIAAVRNA